jgi:hypothetical protein
MIRYVSSAYLSMELPGVAVWRLYGCDDVGCGADARSLDYTHRYLPELGDLIS